MFNVLKVFSVLFFQKHLKHKEIHLLVYSFLGMLNIDSNISFFFNIGIISANFNSLGKFLLLITCSFQILAKRSLLILEVSFSILLGIFLYDPALLLSRLLISLRTPSDIISENWQGCSTLTFPFVDRILGWFSNFPIDVSIGSSTLSVSVKTCQVQIQHRKKLVRLTKF